MVFPQFFQYIFLLLGRFSLLHKTESNTNIFNGLSDMTILKLKGKNHFCIDKLTFIRKKILKGKWRRRKEHDGSACITDSSLLVEIYPAD